MMLGSWVFRWANSEDEAARHEGTNRILTYIHALPKVVRDAIRDDLKARDTIEFAQAVEKAMASS